jgi:hypothetical protein
MCSVLLYLAREGEGRRNLPVQDRATGTHVEVCVLAGYSSRLDIYRGLHEPRAV